MAEVLNSLKVAASLPNLVPRSCWPGPARGRRQWPEKHCSYEQ